MRANKGQQRPTKGKTQVNKGPQRPTTANDSQRRPTQVNEGPQRPTKANAGPYVSALRMFFFVFCSKLTILYKFYLAGCRPTQADKGPQQPMTANEGQRRHTKTKRGPNDVSGVVWSIICFFFQMYNLFVIFLLLAVVLVHVFSLTSRGLSLTEPYQAEPKPGFSSRAGPCTSLAAIHRDGLH